MLVVIDESGCPGFKLNKGSTAYFVIGMVIFHDLSVAEQASREIALLRETMKVKPEFKFSKTCAAVKDEFFTTICKFDFKVRALVVNKQMPYSKHLSSEKESFYNFFTRLLMQHDQGHLQEASIKIDGSGDRKFQQALKSYLSKQLGDRKIKKFKFVESHKDNLIQLADMVVGAIARSYNPAREQAERWLEMLKSHKRIDNIWDYK